MQASVVLVLGLLSQIQSDRGLGFEDSPQRCQCVAGQGLGYGVGDDCRLSEEKGRGSRGSSSLGKQHALGITGDNDIRCAAAGIARYGRISDGIKALRSALWAGLRRNRLPPAREASGFSPRSRARAA